jgi:hypothetical protein
LQIDLAFCQYGSGGQFQDNPGAVGLELVDPYLAHRTAKGLLLWHGPHTGSRQIHYDPGRFRQ